MGDTEINAYALTDFLILSTLKDWIHFVYNKKNKSSLRNFFTLELDWTWFFELIKVSGKIWVA